MPRAIWRLVSFLLGLEENVLKYFSIFLFIIITTSGCGLDESRVISLCLQSLPINGGYTVVLPETYFDHFDLSDQEEIQSTKAYIKEHLKIEGYDMAPLLDEFFKMNKESISLNLKSSTKKGYFIDYDGTYQSYLKNGGGGWQKWYEENPKAYGLTKISRPVYDSDNGIVLIYRGTTAGMLAGSGYIVAYKYEGNGMKELGHVMLWAS